MRFVERAVTKPSRCAVFPQLGGDHVDGYLDTGSEMPGKGDQWDFHIYVSLVAVRSMAQHIGWSPPEKVDELTDRIAGLEEELELAHDDLNKAESVIDAIDAIESADFRARRKAGRRPNRKEEVTV